jgi:hypothetical protein
MKDDDAEALRLRRLRAELRAPLEARRRKLDQALKARPPRKGLESHRCLCAFARAISADMPGPVPPGVSSLHAYEITDRRGTLLRGERIVVLNRTTGRAAQLERLGEPCCREFFG